MLIKTSLLLIGLSAIFFLGGMMLANRELIPPTVGMGLFVLGGALGLLSAIVAVIVMVKLHNYPVAMLGLLGLLPLLAVLAPALQNGGYPMINDISTDLENPPHFVINLSLGTNFKRDMAFPAGNAAIIREAYKDLEPLQTTKSKKDIFILLLSVVQKMPRWKITHRDFESGIIEGVATTRMFHWHDDFVIRVQATAEGGSIIDMRSKSRDGKGDLGANAARIREFFGKLTENIAASS